MVPVYFVVPAGLVLLDLAGPAEAFRIANKLRPGSFALHYCGPEPEVECGLAGLHLSRLAPLPASLPAQALVVVPGVVDAAFQLDRPPLRAVVDWLARCRAQGRFDLMSVCSGALLAAAAGLPAHRECTSHHHCLPGLARLEPTARIHDNRIFVEDDGIWTSAGVTAGIDLALYLVSRACGPRVRAARGQRRGARPGGLPAPRRHRPGHLALAGRPQPHAPRRAPGAGRHRAQSRGGLDAANPGGAGPYQRAPSQPPVCRARGLHAHGLPVPGAAGAGARTDPRDAAGPRTRGRARRIRLGPPYAAGLAPPRIGLAQRRPAPPDAAAP